MVGNSFKGIIEEVYETVEVTNVVGQNAIVITQDDIEYTIPCAKLLDDDQNYDEAEKI